MEHFIEIREFDGEGVGGYQVCGDFMLSVLNFLPRLVPEQVVSMQKHTESDECFVLVSGRALLFTANGEEKPETVACCVMEPGKIYTVPKNIWHQPVMSRDAKIILAERTDTSDENSPRLPLTDEQRATVRELGKGFEA